MRYFSSANLHNGIACVPPCLFRISLSVRSHSEIINASKIEGHDDTGQNGKTPLCLEEAKQTTKQRAQALAP